MKDSVPPLGLFAGIPRRLGFVSNLPDGAFQISAEKPRLIGVTYGEVSYGQM